MHALLSAAIPVMAATMPAVSQSTSPTAKSDGRPDGAIGAIIDAFRVHAIVAINAECQR